MLNTLEMDKEDVLKLITYLKKVKEINFRIGYVQFTIISLFSYILPAAFLALIAYVGVFNSKTIFFMIFLFFYMLFNDLGFKDYLKNYTHYTIDFEKNEIRLRNMFTQKHKVISKNEIEQIAFEISKLRGKPAHWITIFLKGGEIVRLNLSYYKGVGVPHSLFLRYPSLYLPWFRFIEKDRILGYENVLNYFFKNTPLGGAYNFLTAAYITKLLNIDLKNYLLKNGYFNKKKIKEFYEKSFRKVEEEFLGV